jgi:hypothetical protein
MKNYSELYSSVLYLKNVLRFSRICFRHSEEGSARRESLVAEKSNKTNAQNDVTNLNDIILK